MRIASYQFPVFKPYNKSTLEIYFQGCFGRPCLQFCCNPELQRVDSGTETTVDEIIQYIDQRIEFIKCVSFTGGDPLLQNLEELYSLVVSIKKRYPEVELWLFTGESELEMIPYWCHLEFDRIKYGPFDPKLATSSFPSSANQKVVGKMNV